MLVLDALMMKTETPEARFVERVFHLRVLGLGLGFFVVGAVLRENGAGPLAWALLVADAFLWPHVARLLAARSVDPDRAETRNLLIDSAMGGVWVALMQFNLMPSALLVAMLAIDKISVGGWHLLRRALALQIAACLVTAVATGFAFQPHTSTLTVALSLPFLFAYPIAVTTANYALVRAARRDNRALTRQTRVDGPTGLLNRSSWEEAVDHELRRFKRGGAPASLLMIDIDRFKEINDRYGHLAGDEMIRETAALIVRCIRDVDVPGRYGGDEFGVALVHTGVHAAKVVAERIRQNASELRLTRAPDARCTLSIGIAPATRDTQDVHGWILDADGALYRAKAEGRDRTVHV